MRGISVALFFAGRIPSCFKRLSPHGLIYVIRAVALGSYIDAVYARAKAATVLGCFLQPMPGGLKQAQVETY